MWQHSSPGYSDTVGRLKWHRSRALTSKPFDADAGTSTVILPSAQRDGSENRAVDDRPLKKTPGIHEEVKNVADEHRGGDPMGKRKYVQCSLRTIAERVGKISHETVRRILRNLGYALRVNVKRISGKPHPDRDLQFRYIQKKRKRFQKNGLPVISVDTKKTELIGNFKNNGRTWSQKPDEVRMYDFPSDAECRAIPYGIYDIMNKEGHVCVGTSSDTSKFAVRSIRSWWNRNGRERFGQATEIMIEADGGGSNGHRRRLWKSELQRWADEERLTIHVCHYPPGASKWNPIEHRLFGPISNNWKGQPLRSLRLMLAAIRGTKNNGGLSVTAERDKRSYKMKVKVSDEQMEMLNLKRHKTCPDWNYTIIPRQY